MCSSDLYTVSWNQANTEAMALQYNGNLGHLATVTSKSENDFVSSLRRSMGAKEFWLGGYQLPGHENDPAGGWMWVNGEGAMTYNNWHAGEPNDAWGPGSEQYLGIGLFNDGSWNDEGLKCLIRGYVVEYEPALRAGPPRVPEAGSTLSLAAIAAAFAGFARRSLRRQS